jgi:hypothetical protein
MTDYDGDLLLSLLTTWKRAEEPADCTLGSLSSSSLITKGIVASTQASNTPFGG